jgi:prepilin-type N-terminal cleavage/methylation domain-containing protein
MPTDAGLKNSGMNSRNRARRRGFSLVELLVALGVFLVVGGAAFEVVHRHMPLFTSQQNQAALNFNLRNAAAQMQIDMVNAGSGYFPGSDIAAWPLGVVITNSNNGNTNCYDSATHTYGAGCFDSVNIVTAGSNPAHPTACIDTSNATAINVMPVSGTLSDLASTFKTGDQILVLSSDGLQMTTMKLTADGQVSGSAVKLSHTTTDANGVNSSTNDPYDISTDADNTHLYAKFCSDDWVLNLNPARNTSVRYYVDATTEPSSPRLIRDANGTKDIVADQVIGFKVGASVKYDPSVVGACGEAAAAGEVTDTGFKYKASACPSAGGYKNNWYSIRAVRITVIGRTPPVSGPTTYTNNFDQGPYRVEAVSIVVNPRNLSMND